MIGATPARASWVQTQSTPAEAEPGHREKRRRGADLPADTRIGVRAPL